MDARYARCFVVVFAIHVAIIVGMLLVPEVLRLFRKPRPLIVPIEFLVEVDGSPEPPTPKPPTPKPPTPKPPTPKPPPPKPPAPDAVSVKPVKPPVKARQIERNTNRVVRTRYSATPVRSRLTVEEIERLLAMNAQPSDRTQIPDEDSRGLDIIRRTLYAAWTQPEASSVAAPVAEVELMLDTRGTVLSARIVRGSGSAEFDASVRAAIAAVGRIDGLTSAFLSRFSRVTVAFRLE